MKKNSIAYPYLVLGLFLFCWISLPKEISDRARSFAVASFFPAWKWGGKLISEGSPSGDRTELLRLQFENQNLRSQIDTVYEWLLFDHRIAEQAELLKGLVQEQGKAEEGYWKAFFQRRASQLRSRLHNQLTAFPSQVVYRDPSSWSSSLWVNGGESDNEALGERVISKNSPVVAGGSLVGVVDYVGKKQSRVRLITDSSLSPAVRAVRGASQNRELAQQIQSLLNRLEKREDLFSSKEEWSRLTRELEQLKEKTGSQWEDGYLAKGELHGSSTSFWRSRGSLLKGIGFNFDYADEEGSSCDLKIGSTPRGSSKPVPLLKEGDLLVTSGLDGVFPPGLLVATVARISPLKEGAYAYELEARPSAVNLNDLQTVFILPSLSSE